MSDSIQSYHYFHIIIFKVKCQPFVNKVNINTDCKTPKLLFDTNSPNKPCKLTF